MPEYGAPHESLHIDQQGSNLFSIYKAFAGTVLIVIGVVLGLYVAIAAFNIIDGDDPPGIVNRFAVPAAENTVEKAKEQTGPQFDLSPDLKRIAVYVLAFLILILPATVATTLISTGAKLLRGEATEALNLLAERLKRST